METKTKTIDTLNFEISQPYTEGHTISAIEAKVLNQTRSENIGNNVRAKVKEMRAAGSSVEDITAHVASVDAEYIFTSARVAAGAKLDPYEKEAVTIARGLLRNHLAQDGRKLNTAPEGTAQEDWDALVQSEVDRIATTSEVIAAAKKAVDARRKQADSLLTVVEGTTL